MEQENKSYPRIDCIDHIECILPEGKDLEPEVNRILRSVYKDGREPIYVVGTPSLEGDNPMKGTVIAVGHTDGLQVVAAMDNREEKPLIGTFYPVGRPLESVEPRHGLCNFMQTECDLEAYGRLFGDSLTFSVANYPAVKDTDGYKNVSEFDVDIVGFSYFCKKVDENTPRETQVLDMCQTDWYDKLSPEDRETIDRDWNVGEDKKVTLDLTFMKTFYQRNDKYPDEFVFASPVYDIDEVEVFGLPMYRMKLMTSEAFFDGEEDEFITVYAKKMIFPGGLKKGDFVKGTGWLQGIFRNF